MFYTAIRNNYSVSADVEALQIKDRENAYKVVYKGSRVFAVYPTPECETEYLRYASTHPMHLPNDCPCWS